MDTSRVDGVKAPPHRGTPRSHFALVELHVRNPVHEEAAGPVFSLIYGYFVALLVQDVGAGEAGGARADDGDAQPGPRLGDARLDPALGEAALDDRVLHVLDRDGRINETRDARPLARRRADATRKLREVIGLM
jgi:hypothetical protein